MIVKNSDKVRYIHDPAINNKRSQDYFLNPLVSESNFYWNQILVKNFYYNRKKYPNVFINGIHVLRPLPIPDNTYIYYDFDKNDGFGVENGYNVVIDSGNTGINGQIYSGNNINLTMSYIDIPVNVISENNLINGDTWSVYMYNHPDNYYKNNTSNSITLVNKVPGTNPHRPAISIYTETLLINKVYKLRFNAKINSGRVYISFIDIGEEEDVAIFLKNGYNEISITTSTNFAPNNKLTIFFNGIYLEPFEVELTDIYFEEVMDVKGSVVIYDITSKKFIQNRLSFIPNDFKYHIENKQIGSILTLWNNVFSQSDMDLINSNPNILIDWYRGNKTDLSITVEENDRFYPNTEDLNNIILDMDTEISPNIIKNSDFDTTDYWDITNGNFDVQDGRGIVQVASNEEIAKFFYTDEIQAGGRIFIFEIDIISTNANRIIVNNTENIITKPGKYQFILYNNITLPIEILVFGSGSIVELDNIHLYEVTSEYLKIETNIVAQYPFLRHKNEPLGMDRIRTIENNLGLPLRAVDNKLVYFNGKRNVIDTGVSIDGSQNSFGIMMSFSLPLTDTGENQYIVNGTGRRFVFIMHRTGEPLNVLYVGIGGQVFQVTLDPNLTFHAMVVNWNKDTGEFTFAVDGLPLSQPIPGDFYSFTNYFYLGAYNINGDYSFNGFIGGGLMASNLIDENTWQDFWEKNKDKKPIQEDIVLSCDNYRFCNEPIKCGEPTFIDCEEFLECTDEIVCWE